MRTRFLFGSLVLHMTFFGWLIFSFKPPESNLQEPIEINLSRDLGPKTSLKKQKYNSRKGFRSYLVPGLKPSLGISDEKNKLYSDTHNWKTSNEYAFDSMNAFEGYDNYEVRFFKSLWNEIDKSIERNRFLAEYGHIGQVFLKFELSPEGQIIPGSLEAQAEDNVLKVIAARAIRKALKNTDQQLVLPNKRFLIHTRFSWSGYEACKQLKGIQKNYLSFCNYSEDKRKTFSNSEKAKTYLGALSYGFGAIEAIQEYKKEENRRNTKFDPFEEYRRDPDWYLGS